MKTMINLVTNGQLVAALKEILNRAIGSSNKLRLIPVHTFTSLELNTAEKLAGMVRK